MPTTIPATDVSVEVSADSVQRGFQRAGFFALGRFWAFYIREGVIPVLVFDSSVVESGVWSGETAFGVALTDGAEFSLTLEEINPTTAFVHLAWADATGSNPLNYVRGALGVGGNIAWDAAQVVAVPPLGWEIENPGICLNFGLVNPFVFIVYTQVNIADPTLCTPWFTMSITSNGTWTTGAGFPTQVTAVNDPSWIPMVAPVGTEVIVVYAADSGSIYSRLYSGGMFAPEVDSGHVIGIDAGKMSIAAERIYQGGIWSGDRVHVAYQAPDWDLKCRSYIIALGWGAAVTIQSIGNFRQANPLLSIMKYGDDDTGVADHLTGTLYCFWTPTADIPTAEWVTYKVSRDQNTTWTNEAGANAAEEWIDETGNGFEVQQSGSVYAFSSEDYESDLGRSYIGIFYVTHTMPPTLRHAALGFDDPAVDLACAFVVNHDTSLDLLGEFVVRHNSDGDITPEDLFAKFEVRITDASQDLKGQFVVGQGSADLLGEFVVQQPGAAQIWGNFFLGADGDVDLKGQFDIRSSASQDLPGEFVVIGPGDEELLGVLVVRHPDSEDLKGIFIVRHPDSEELLAVFEISREDWLSKGLNVSVYRDLGVVS